MDLFLTIVQWLVAIGLGLFLLFVAYRFLSFLRLIVRTIQEEREFARMQDTHDLARRIEKDLQRYVSRRTNARLAVGIWQRDRHAFFGFAGQEASRLPRPDGQSLYEIGSITKVFTGVLLALLVKEEAVGLDDPITKYLPSEWTLPDSLGAITLRHLATHTSGLPRLPDNLDATVLDEANPYANYREADLRHALETVALSRTPGSGTEYSNLGMGLLGFLLARRMETSFETLVKQKICQPLGMTDTTMTLSIDEEARLIRGHSSDGEPTKRWENDVLAGAGGLISTVNDQLKFLLANFAGQGGPLAPALTLAREKHATGYGGDAQGLGWCISHTPPLHWHNGGTGGYVSFAGLNHNERIAVVLLSNYGDAMTGNDELDRLGFRLLRMASKVTLERERI